MTPLCKIVEALLSYAGWPRKEHWLAELVVQLVEERTQLYFKTTRQGEVGCRQRTLQDFDITPKQFGEIKRRLDEKG